MSNCRVTVRIRPYVKHRLVSSQSAELPAKLEIGPYTFIADTGGESHSVLVELASVDAQSAILDAVVQIRDLLVALAARGDAYAIEIYPRRKLRPTRRQPV